MSALAPALYQGMLAEARESAASRERERDDAADMEARRDEAEAAMRAYYSEHGEWPTDTIHRQALMQARHEEAERQAEKERLAEKYADDLARVQLQGYRPRSVAEVLAVARGSEWS
jgi:hypothetical protein